MTPEPKKRLKKELNLFNVYAIATGATLSSGFFLLPGLAAADIGSSVVLAYLIAAIPLIPSTFCLVELATAMPRAGGVYYFLDRTLGPWSGTIGGIGTWLALVLKVAFALVGMGAYLEIFFPEVSIKTSAVGFALVLGALNYLGSKKSGAFQSLLVMGLLAVLAGFIGTGLTDLNLANFRDMTHIPIDNLLSAAGFVYISYVGVTKVASLSEEVHNPERNLPLGIFLALITAILIYGLGTTVMVGLIPPDILAGDLCPAATAAKVVLGDAGVLAISMAALVAFISVANAGLMSASRYPLAMSRDHLLPRVFQRIGKTGIPNVALATTLAVIIGSILFLDVGKIAKLASAFQLFMFALVCLAVIVMREAHLISYDPGYRSPLYPWLPLFGIVSACVLIFEMGAWSLGFTLGLALASTFWFFYYGRKRTSRTGAIFHVFERLGRSRYEGLDHELRGILREKGLREEDPFEEVVARSLVIDLDHPVEFEAVVEDVAAWMANHTEHTAEEIRDQLLERTHIGATPVTHGVGLPHLWIQELQHPELVLVRSRDPGIHIQYAHPLTDEETEENLKAIFFLFSPSDDPSRHLRILAQIAEHVDLDSFESAWDEAANEQELKEVLLHDERFESLVVSPEGRTSALVGHPLREVELPDGVLIAMIRRGSHVHVPDGDTVLEAGDSLTIIGDADGLRALRDAYDSEG
tara:strand:+ start:1100 stop:3190 length:2091 start_codon:yes stop_codon:yes gene_type:complete